jgi:hypothetical protein
VGPSRRRIGPAFRRAEGGIAVSMVGLGDPEVFDQSGDRVPRRVHLTVDELPYRRDHVTRDRRRRSMRRGRRLGLSGGGGGGVGRRRSGWCGCCGRGRGRCGGCDGRRGRGWCGGYDRYGGGGRGRDRLGRRRSPHHRAGAGRHERRSCRKGGCGGRRGRRTAANGCRRRSGPARRRRPRRPGGLGRGGATPRPAGFVRRTLPRARHQPEGDEEGGGDATGGADSASAAPVGRRAMADRGRARAGRDTRRDKFRPVGHLLDLVNLAELGGEEDLLQTQHAFVNPLLPGHRSLFPPSNAGCAPPRSMFPEHVSATSFCTINAPARVGQTPRPTL